MWLLLACTQPFPCASDELLDAKGDCHAASADSSGPVGGTDSGEPSGTDSGEPSGTDSDGPTDSDEPTDSGDSGDDPDPSPIMDDGWPANFLAPYVDATAYPTVRIGSIPAENGVYRYTLAFVVAASPTTCEATWGTYYSIETGPSAWEGGGEYFLYDEITTLRAAGGDVMVSFGGAANTPIEAACPDVDSIVAEYQRVILTLDLTRVDFDIEGAWVADSASIARRSEAIVALQEWAQAEGRALHVWYTLPVLPTGLTAEGVAVVQSAADYGVALDGVNVMTMDYGDGAAPSPDGMMGEYGIDAITAVKEQLGAIWPGLSDAELWAMVGSTPMIGQNDVQSEFFDIEDAQQTRDFAEANGVGMLGYWSINRDHPCDSETPWAQSNCNGRTDILDWAFADVFAGYGE